MKLDVGCGDSPRGNVNCDLFIGKSPHGKVVNPKSIPNFVKADIHHLPFKTEAFKKTSCYHVLEHKGVEPNKALNELLRVTSELLTIVVPHRFSKTANFPFHARIFTRKTLRTWLRRKGLSVEVYNIYKYFPHRAINIMPFLLRMPNLLRAEIRVE